jgi:hypothetical protein
MSRFVPDVQKTSVANRNPSQLLTMLVTQMDKVELRHHGFSRSSLYKVTSEQALRNLLIEALDHWCKAL